MCCIFHVKFRACAAIFGPKKCRFRRFWRSVGPSGSRSDAACGSRLVGPTSITARSRGGSTRPVAITITFRTAGLAITTVLSSRAGEQKPWQRTRPAKKQTREYHLHRASRVRGVEALWWPRRGWAAQVWGGQGRDERAVRSGWKDGMSWRFGSLTELGMGLIYELSRRSQPCRWPLSKSGGGGGGAPPRRMSTLNRRCSQTPPPPSRRPDTGGHSRGCNASPLVHTES